MPNGDILLHFIARITGRKVVLDTPIVRMVAVAYCLHTALIVAGVIGSEFIPQREAVGFVNISVTGVVPFIDKLVKWDAHWYTFIAEHGYSSQSIVFFPAIIVLIKTVAGVGFDYVTAGFIVCNLFTLISYWVMAKTLLLDFSVSETQRALLAYAVLPTAFFLNSIYTEPIFIVFSLAAIYCVRTGGWWLAGGWTALAAMTRNLGILLVLLLFVDYVRYFCRIRRFKVSMFSFLLPVGAVAAFSVYNYSMFGDWLAFVHSQQLWGRRFGLPWDNFANNLTLIRDGVPLLEAGVYADTILVTLTFVALMAVSILSRFRVPWPYVMIGWLWFLVPLFSTSPIYPLYSMARFVLVIFPLYLFLARLPNLLYYSLLGTSAVGLIYGTAFFINWYWLG